jgi:hypothetical protein
MKKLQKGGLVTFLISALVTNVAAEIRQGVVVDKQPSPPDAVNIYIRVDKNRPYDYIIQIQTVGLPNSLGRGLNMIIDKGTVIEFEDYGMTQHDTDKYG